MNYDEIAIFAGPRSDYADVIVAALNEECIPARVVPIADVAPEKRPVWAHESVLEIYVVVPCAKREASLELVRWVSRVCLRCDAPLMPKVRACQKCGTPHLTEPGPFSMSDRE
jgi:ribosomal protein L40E